MGGGGSHICRKPGGDHISAENLYAGDPMSAGNLDGEGGSHICRKPRSGRSHICRRPRCGVGGGSHLCRKNRWGDPIPTGSQILDPISAGNLDGGGGIPFVQET